MKHAILLTFFSFALSNIYSQGIEFVHVKWQEALEMAKENNQLLFVDSYTTWCGPCKRMSKHEFVKAEVGEVYNANFVNLKLDMESKNGRIFDSKYPVSAYPTMFFLDGEGNVVKKVKGGKKGDQLVAMANAVIKSYDTSGQFQEKYDAGDRSYDVVYDLVVALNKANKPSLKISNDYLMSNPEITDEQQMKFYHAAVVDSDSKIFDNMVKNRSRLIEIVGEEAFDKKVKSACMNTVTKAIQYETISLLDEAVLKSKYLTNGAEEFALEAKMKYASDMRDAEMYTEVANDLANKYLKNDPEKIDNLINITNKYFGANEELLKMSKSIAKKYYKKSKSDQSILSYAKVLIQSEDYDDAEKVLTKEIKAGKKEGKQVKTLEMLLKLVQTKKEKKQ